MLYVPYTLPVGSLLLVNMPLVYCMHADRLVVLERLGEKPLHQSMHPGEHSRNLHT